MSFVEVGESVYDTQSVHRVIELMQQMVCRYLNLNVSCHSLRFYVPGYFIDQLVHHHYTHGQLKGLDLRGEQLAVWGVEVYAGYENTIVLFCPGHVPSSHSPVITIRHFGLRSMEIMSRN